jgi:hypothetical protein
MMMIIIDRNLKINGTKCRKGSAAFDITVFCGKDKKTPGMKCVYSIETDFDMRIFQIV